MPLLIGMDEAGYGPNLGPLVLTATVWELAGDPRKADLWNAFRDVVTNTAEPGDSRLHLADSKVVYSPARGLGPLERTVLAACGLLDFAPDTWNRLLNAFCDSSDESYLDCRWCRGIELRLPFTGKSDDRDAAMRWSETCRETGIVLKRIHTDVVSEARFNRLIAEHGNKAAALSRTSMQLLSRAWDPGSDEPAFVVADKHGGRNRYDDLLDGIVDGRMIFRQEESRRLSRYRVGKTELRFEMRAESHLPVALASMVCKYVRELAMELLNRFWQSHVPGLKPTKGYPVDAKRFKTDIAAAQSQLGIPDDEIWRCR